MKESSTTVVTNYNKHCGISKDRKLICWGMNMFSPARRFESRKYDEEIRGGVTSVSVGYELVC